MPTTNAGFVVRTLAWATVITTTIWILVLLHQHAAHDKELSVSVAAGALYCADTNECTRNEYKAATDTCVLEHYSARKACSTCYTAGHCDGAGACTGALADCYGTCDAGPAGDGGAFCDERFVWDAGWVAVQAHTDDIPDITTWCWANNCVGLATFDVADGSNPIATTTGVLDCSQLLDAAFYAANGSCLHIVREVLEEPHRSTYSTVACRYWWKCGQFDDQWMLDWVDAD